MSEIKFSFPFRAENNLHIDIMNRMFQYNLKVLPFGFLICMVLVLLET